MWSGFRVDAATTVSFCRWRRMSLLTSAAGSPGLTMPPAALTLGPGCSFTPAPPCGDCALISVCRDAIQNATRRADAKRFVMTNLGRPGAADFHDVEKPGGSTTASDS